MFFLFKEKNPWVSANEHSLKLPVSWKNEVVHDVTCGRNYSIFTEYHSFSQYTRCNASNHKMPDGLKISLIRCWKIVKVRIPNCCTVFQIKRPTPRNTLIPLWRSPGMRQDSTHYMLNSSKSPTLCPSTQ